MGPPTSITTIGEARKARRQQTLEARASKEDCPVSAIQDQQREITKGKVNTMASTTPSTTPNAKGTGKSVPQTKDAKNAKPQVKYLDQYFVRKGGNLSILADVVPEPPQEASSTTNDSWRGFPRPKEPPVAQPSTWEGTAKWPSWNNWKE